MLTADLFTDEILNVSGDTTYVDRDDWLPVPVYGQELNLDGSHVFPFSRQCIDGVLRTEGILLHPATTEPSSLDCVARTPTLSMYNAKELIAKRSCSHGLPEFTPDFIQGHR